MPKDNRFASDEPITDEPEIDEGWRLNESFSSYPNAGAYLCEAKAYAESLAGGGGLHRGCASWTHAVCLDELGGMETYMCPIHEMALIAAGIAVTRLGGTS